MSDGTGIDGAGSDDAGSAAGPPILKYAVLSDTGDVQMVGSMHDSPAAAQLLAGINGVRITAEQADRIGRNPASWRMLFDGTLQPRPPAEVLLADAQDQAARAVDAGAEALRLRFITPGSGQALVYGQKKDETDRFLAKYSSKDAWQADPDGVGSVDFPLINAEVGITADTAWDVAQAMRAMSEQWTAVAAQIETVRLSAKAAIAAATTNAGVAAAQAAVAWPSDLPS